MHDIARLHQSDLVLIHELGPAFHHDHDLEVADMIVPAGAVGGRHVGPYQMGDDLSLGGARDAEIAIKKKIAQAAGSIISVARLGMAEESGLRLLAHRCA